MSAPSIEALWKHGTLLDLSIGRSLFEKKSRPVDLLREDIDLSAFHLGHKKLLPKKALEKIVEIEGKARNFVLSRSMAFPIAGARFVTTKALPQVIAKLSELKEEWEAEVDNVIKMYPTYREEQLAILDKAAADMVQEKLEGLKDDVAKDLEPKLAAWLDAQQQGNRAMYPSVDKLPGMFRFGWDTFEIVPSKGVANSSEAAAQKSKDWVKWAMGAIHKSLGETANNVLYQLSKHSKITQRNVKPLFEAFDSFESVDFTGSSEARKSIDAIKKAFLIKTDGEPDYAKTSDAICATTGGQSQFVEMMKPLAALNTEATAEEAGENSLLAVGEFRRFLEA